MSHESDLVQRSISPLSSAGRASPVPGTLRQHAEASPKPDKAQRKYAAAIEKALASFDPSQQGWADYIAFLGRLLKAVQLRRDVTAIPHSNLMSLRLAQCLNPSLPSGVHQKAVEAYAQVFEALGPNVNIYLQVFLPGLVPVLSFASLTVRPLFYDLFERHILPLSSNDLRPTVKSLILSLLPGIEDETSEDFERGIRILDKLRYAESQEVDYDAAPTNEDAATHVAYFWQCLFLAVMTSDGRRPGALIYLHKRLPLFTTLNERNSTENAAAILRPDPGLLIRCFAAGLQDANILVQRGFLDLLVSRLPLKSELLQHAVQVADLDILVAASISVVLRRDMSLNRRLWAWFLGPESSNGEGATHDAGTASPGVNDGPDVNDLQTTYFRHAGLQPLKRCILAMLETKSTRATDQTRPFRLCSAIMDRWEIGGQLIRDIFIPVMLSAYNNSKDGDPKIAGEVFRSASIFFDGIESSLIWTKIDAELVTSIQHKIPTIEDIQSTLHFIKYLVTTFNIHEEDMLIQHIPKTALLMIDGVTREGWSNDEKLKTATSLIFDLLEHLLPLVPDHAFKNFDVDKASGIDEPEHSLQREARTTNGSRGMNLNELTIRAIEKLIIACLEHRMMQAFIGRASDLLLSTLDRRAKFRWTVDNHLLDVMARYLADVGRAYQDDELAFSTVNAIASILFAALDSPSPLPPDELAAMSSDLASHAWISLGLSHPKNQVEATGLLWRLEQISSSHSDTLRLSTFVSQRLLAAPDIETVTRFMVFWDLTFHGSGDGPSRKGNQAMRRSSSFLPVHDLGAANVEQVMKRPLLLVLDTLNKGNSDIDALVITWLRTLPGLDRVLLILLTDVETGLAASKMTGKESKHTTRTGRVLLDIFNGLQTTLSHLLCVLTHGSDNAWDVLARLLSSSPEGVQQPFTGIQFVANFCIQLLETVDSTLQLPLVRQVLGLLEAMYASKYAYTLRELLIENRFVILLRQVLINGPAALQLDYLRLIATSVKSMQSDQYLPPPGENIKDVTTTKRFPALQHPTEPSTPQGLFECIKEALVAPKAKPLLEHWVRFLGNLLPLYSKDLFTSLIPLVECFCAQIDKTFDMLKRISGQLIRPSDQANVSTIFWLLQGLELVLAEAHGQLALDTGDIVSARPPSSPHGLFGTAPAIVASPGGQLISAARSNTRLTVILCIHDAVDVCFRLWAWGNEPGQIELSSVSTAAFNAQRTRNRVKKLLEHLFAAEGLESLEVLMLIWLRAIRDTSQELKPSAIFSLLNVLSATRPRATLPLILNAIYSRTNVDALDPGRRSTLTKDLTALETSSFLLSFVQSVEDDALDEMWQDCVVFLKDVLSNPMPHRLILPSLLEFVVLVSGKLDNTNFGDVAKMHRELSDMFTRLLTAIFTVRPSGSSNIRGRTTQGNTANGDPMTSLIRIMPMLQSVLENNDRVLGACNNITTYLISPSLHAKSFPDTVSTELLELLRAVATQTPDGKLWKKEISDAFNDPRIFGVSGQKMSQSWFGILRKWSLADAASMTDILSRIAPPSAAGLVFGVGASSARLVADRHTQQNLRRVALLLLANETDAVVTNIPAVGEKLAELCTATAASSPSSATQAEMFMVWRALFLSTSSSHMAGMWPLINSNLQAALLSVAPHGLQRDVYGNLSLLQACKFLDLLAVLLPDDFQLQEWVFLTNTIDAVYAHKGPDSAIVDELAGILTFRTATSGEVMADQHAAELELSRLDTLRRPMLCHLELDGADIKVMARDDFVQQTLLPFFSGLSMNAYEQRYQMAAVDVEACRADLIRDLLDEKTVS